MQCINKPKEKNNIVYSPKNRKKNTNETDA